MKRAAALLLLLVLALPLSSSAQTGSQPAASAASQPSGLDVASFEKRVTVRKLPNGLTVILLRRPEAPVFSFYTFVDAGSAQDPKGESGLAHMFEHMAFKGTDTIGTTDYAAEKVALAKVEQAYAAYLDARDQRINPDPAKTEQLQKAWQQAVADAEKYVVRNQFGRIIEENGGVGMNATTTEDETVYFYSFPVNRFELWAYLESSRFLHPVMREFYKERDVVMEERRMRIDSDPISRLVEQFTTAAFTASPYHTPGVGYFSDLQSFSATDAMDFFNKYYVPANIYLAVVGDIDPAQAMPIIEKYFGRLPTRPRPDERVSESEAQKSERRVLIREEAQPFYIEGYHRPDYLSADDPVYDVITDLLSDGRTSRLYRSLVRDQRIAAAAAGFSGFPGSKYPHLFAFYAVPIPGHTPDELRKAIHAEIDKLKTQDVSDAELEMVKTRYKAALIRSLGSNAGLAQELAASEARYHDWREMFRDIDKIDKVTKADIRRVANQTFTDANRTVGILDTAAAPAQQPGGPK
ncbi:MAG TPA: pitrilysin family protein [Terriglobales bacterium]|nr:pitrilysin family protein [Terriglobales bacterium]